jgi:very-short-patch-repair endonuclease
VLLIELDDRTHVASRDAVRDSYMRAAGIGTLRYQSRAKPSEAQIAADVRAMQQAAAVSAGL